VRAPSQDGGYNLSTAAERAAALLPEARPAQPEAATAAKTAISPDCMRWAICHFCSPSTSAIQLCFLRARRDSFPSPFEACDTRRKSDGSTPFERVDADNRVKMVVDPAGDDRHYAAPGAGVKLCGSGTECVLGYERRILTTTFREPPGWGPYAAVLGAKRAVQARAGISAGSSSQVSEKEMFPQWHLRG